MRLKPISGIRKLDFTKISSRDFKIIIEDSKDIMVTDSDGNHIFQVRRENQWNSKITLSFFKQDILFLKTSLFSLRPFGKLKIEFQDLQNTMTYKSKTETAFKSFGVLRIKSNWLYLIHKEVAKVYYKSKIIADVSLKSRISSSITLNVKFTTSNEDLIFYSLIVLVLEYFSIGDHDAF